MLYNKHNKSTTESIARRFERAADPEPPRPPSPPPRPTTPRCPAARAGSASPERGTPRGTPRLSRCHLLYHQAVFAAKKLGMVLIFGPRFWLFFLGVQSATHRLTGLNLLRSCLNSSGSVVSLPQLLSVCP